MSGEAVAPVPQGDYIAAKRHGALIFTSGMTPRRNGVLLFTGPVNSNTPVEIWRDAVELSCGNALFAAQAVLAKDEVICSILSLTVYVAAEDGFTAHSKVADFASEYLKTQLGPAGACARCAIGVATLPGNAPVEISLIAAAQ